MGAPKVWLNAKRPTFEKLGIVGHDELTQEVQPLSLKADLLHVNVDSRHVLISAGKARVVVLA